MAYESYAIEAQFSSALSPVSLSVFSLVPDLLFYCSRVLEHAKIRTVLQSMQQTTERNSIKSNIVGSKSKITWRFRLFDSPIPSQASLFSLSRSSSARRKIKTAEYFLTLKRKETSVDRLLSGLSFSWYDSTESCHEGLFNCFCCVSCSKPFGNPYNAKSEQASEKGGHKCNE